MVGAGIFALIGEVSVIFGCKRNLIHSILFLTKKETNDQIQKFT